MSAHRAITALVLSSVIALVAGCGPDSEPSVTPPTTTSTTTTTTPVTCATFGGTATVSGEADITRTPPIALLTNVQVQASECVDEVSSTSTAESRAGR